MPGSVRKNGDHSSGMHVALPERRSGKQSRAEALCRPYSTFATSRKTADAIAMKLGIDKTAMIRVRAGISYSLDEGHCGLPTEQLLPLASREDQRLSLQKEL
jgi:hypothetical protein